MSSSASCFSLALLVTSDSCSDRQYGVCIIGATRQAHPPEGCDHIVWRTLANSMSLSVTSS